MNKETLLIALPLRHEEWPSSAFGFIEEADKTPLVVGLPNNKARLIVRAVNSHQALVSVLQRIAAEVNALDMSPVLWDDMHAALALAQGEQKEQVQA
jgi:hypothetical protein